MKQQTHVSSIEILPTQGDSLLTSLVFCYNEIVAEFNRQSSYSTWMLLDNPVLSDFTFNVEPEREQEFSMDTDSY
jgi:hypothetical protein